MAKKNINDSYKELKSEAAEDAEDARWLMHVSIRQSLAGPPSDKANLIGKPVSKLTEMYYNSHLYDRNRGIVDQDRRKIDLYQRARQIYDEQERRRGRPAHRREGQGRDQ